MTARATGRGVCRVCDKRSCRIDHDEWPCTKCLSWKSKEEFGLVYRSAYPNRPLRRFSRCVSCVSEKNSSSRQMKQIKQSRSVVLLSRYGITQEQYDELFSKQDGVCRICEKPPSHGQINFDIDHDHSCCPGKRSCGKCVRGLLCRLCNTGLGHFLDNPDLLKRALAYLEGSD